ncbi:hypothetical protein NONO_c73410 [Nocardia nova SH22a]|uniref:Capsid maturation protease n=1 Tax=Nocardia nova SH22a TaxID=1415166 RepID=W5TS39_9NOCA|nr:hypothetical protein [Nocardia nova]AHH22097.1 hypothetical protein NONO_c73410 [Nocardia nova SH22a]
MTITAAERQLILTQVDRLATADLEALWRLAEEKATDDFAAYMIEAFPELATEYASFAADTAAAWYDESPTTTDYFATPGPLPKTEALTTSAQWALGGDGLVGLDRLKGTLQRATFGAARDTITLNADREGSKWARHASASACAFCAMMASRGAVYTSEHAAAGVVGRRNEITLGDRRAIAAGHLTREQAYQARERYASARAAAKVGKVVGAEKSRRTRGIRKLGEKYHDRCHCVAVEVRPGQTYQPPDYVERWDDAYIKASREAPKVGKYGALDPKAILALMRTDLDAR